MRLLFAFLFLSGVASAQNLDTVLVRQNVTMQARDWAWLRGTIGASDDSAILRTDRRIHGLIVPLLPMAWTANVTIDSLPGSLYVAFYKTVKTGNAGEISARYQAIVDVLLGITQLSYWYGLVDGSITRDYNNAINRGKFIYVDQ